MQHNCMWVWAQHTSGPTLNLNISGPAVRPPARQPSRPSTYLHMHTQPCRHTHCKPAHTCPYPSPGLPEAEYFEKLPCGSF